MGDQRRRGGARPGAPRQAAVPADRAACDPQGRLVARNVAATLGTGRVRPFRYRTKGGFADLGRNKAVALTLGVRWRGFPAWFLARTYHLLLMPGLGRKLRLLADWNVGLLFGRDSSDMGQLWRPVPLGATAPPGVRSLDVAAAATASDARAAADTRVSLS
jgi:NADH dehydrogenase